MFGRGSKAPVKVDTLIHRSVQIHGDLEFTGGLHIDGRVAGNVRADADARSMMSMSEKGFVAGSVEACSVILNGTVMGDIRARERVVLGSGARVRGNVYYGIIEMSLGAEINGKLVRIMPGKLEPALTSPRPDPTL
jgi:cytoskeletal protein CcmA (bactofilin family)